MTQTNDGGATDLTTDASGQVRALEWGPSKTSYTQANCVLGQYQITFLGEFECWQLSAPHKQGTDWKDGFTRHASKSAAKAAAQADYERRILAALTPPTTTAARSMCWRGITPPGAGHWRMRCNFTRTSTSTRPR